jgi:hypothetical protein
MSELAGDVGVTGGAEKSRGGSILGPDGKPLSRAGEDHQDNWVHQAAGAARNAIASVRDALEALFLTGRGVLATSPAGRAIEPLPG